LPDDTVEAFKGISSSAIKGPLTTPVGGGIRSLNVALRQMLDLYVCLRPVQYFHWRPVAVKHPEKGHGHPPRKYGGTFTAGIEYAGGTPEAQKALDFIAKEFPKDFKQKIRFWHETESGRSSWKTVGREGFSLDVCVGNRHQAG